MRVLIRTTMLTSCGLDWNSLRRLSRIETGAARQKDVGSTTSLRRCVDERHSRPSVSSRTTTTVGSSPPRYEALSLARVRNLRPRAAYVDIETPAALEITVVGLYARRGR
jgi:hypothetical protein